MMEAVNPLVRRSVHPRDGLSPQGLPMTSLVVHSHHGYSVDVHEATWRLPGGISLSMSHRQLYSKEWPKYGLDPTTPDEIQDYLLRTRCGNLEHYLTQMMHTTTAAGVERLFRILSPIVCRPGPLLDVQSKYAALIVKLNSVINGGQRGQSLLSNFQRTYYAEVFEDGDFVIGTSDGHFELREEVACDVVRTLAAIEACCIDPAAAVAALLVVERGYSCAELATLCVRDGDWPFGRKAIDRWSKEELYPPTVEGDQYFVRHLVDRNQIFSHHCRRYESSPDSLLFQSVHSANGSILPTRWFEEALDNLSSEIRSAGWVCDATPLGWSGFHQMHLARHRDAWLSARKDGGRLAAP